MYKFGVMLTLSLAILRGSTIDAGVVFSRPFFVSDGPTVQFLVSSTGGNFSVSSVLVPGGGNLDCAMFMSTCAFGQTYSIQTDFPDYSSFPSTGTAIVGGNPMGTVVLGCSIYDAPGCAHTQVSLIAQPVVISAPGAYVVPFTATGQIQASIGAGPLIIDQTIDGVGLLYFSVSERVPGIFQFDTLPRSGPMEELQWNFVSVPEPATYLSCLLVLAAIWWQRRKPN